jgi:hypothetical protein
MRSYGNAHRRAIARVWTVPRRRFDRYVPLVWRPNLKPVEDVIGSPICDPIYGVLQIPARSIPVKGGQGARRCKESADNEQREMDQA